MILLLQFWALLPGLVAPPAVEVDNAFFETKIRPALVEHCHSCHSEKSGKSKGGLLLDSRSAFQKGGESGPLIDAKNPKHSRLLVAISFEEPDLRMPPKGKLPEQVIKDFQTWVEKGATWPQTGETKGNPGRANSEAFDLVQRKKSHWSWGPLKPNGFNSGPDDPVDQYLDRKRSEKGIAAAAMADPATLYRRLHFVITGMGPNEADVRRFLASPTQEAYLREVDRLLDSWDYAEHWGRHWLDLVRYGETRGHEFDFPIPNAWQYRDYIIRALKEDVSYKDLLREHLAGDLLPQPRLRGPNQRNESLLATGFFFLGEEVHSPVDVRQDQAERFDNRIDVLTKTFLGMTVACARCHDHKFDAISTRDYYALYAMLESASYRQARFEHGPSNRDLAGRWSAERLRTEANWRREAAGLVKARFAAESDSTRGMSPEIREWLAQGKKSASPDGDPKSVRVDYSEPQGWYPDDVSFGPGPRSALSLDIQGGQARLLPYTSASRDPFWEGLGQSDPGDKEPGALAYKGAGRTLKTPSFGIQSGTLWVWMRGQAKIHASVGSHVMILGPLHGEMVADSGPSPQFRWVKLGLTRYKDLPCHLEFTTEDAQFAVSRVVDQPDQPGTPFLNELPSGLDGKARQDWWRQTVMQALDRWENGEAQASGLSARLLADWVEHSGLGGDLIRLPALLERERVRAHLASERKLVSPHAPAIWEGSRVLEKVFVRGSPKVLGAIEQPRNLEALGANLVGPGSGRLALAMEWTDPRQTPLVPRVAINRIWQHLFGRGIVHTVDNLGVLGDENQHQELMDGLAQDFVREGWSIKRMIKRLVLTRAFRQSSDAAEGALVLDPENRLLHHYPPRRLSGESIRDQLLKISGELSPERFGPPAAPWINAFQEGRGRPDSGSVTEGNRRSIYVGVRRNFLSQWMLTFDTPIPFSTVGRRSESHVPAQSLILLNHPLVHELTEKWGAKLARDPAQPAQKIQALWRSTFARDAQPEEIKECVDFLQGEGGPAWANDPAAWKSLTHALVNTREFVFIR